MQLATNSDNLRRDWVNASSSSNTKQSQAWRDFGWPDELEFNDYYKMFRRNPIARRVIVAKPEQCWSKPPQVQKGREIADGATWGEFEELADRISLWKKLKEADIKQRVGRYGAYLIQISGSAIEADWSQPLGRIRPEQVVGLLPVYEEQLIPSDWENDPTSLRYGLPKIYTYNEGAIDNQNDSAVKRSVTVHHTRCVVFSELRESNGIYGMSQLESVFNDLLNLELIGGSSAQGFFLNSGTKMHFNVNPEFGGTLTDDEKTEFDEAIKDFVEKLDQHLITQGMDGKKLEASMVQPAEFHDMYLSNVAAGSDTPKNILVGTQTGVLAGDKDAEAWLTVCNSRCQNWCSELVESFIDWCMEHGVLQRRRYVVQFDDLLSVSDKDKIELVSKMAAANKMWLDSQLGAMEKTELFTLEEIRMTGGYKTDVVSVVEVDDVVEPEPAE